jgi:tetratricopeptide (TPR) repeat protein
VHNLAILDFHGGGCGEPRALLLALLRAQVQADGHARCRWTAAGGGGEVGSDAGAPGGGGSGDKNAGTGAVAGPEAVPNPHDQGLPPDLDDHGHDTLVLRMNTAFALQELRHTALSVVILEPLFRTLEAVDDAVALRVCALLTRVGGRGVLGAAARSIGTLDIGVPSTFCARVFHHSATCAGVTLAFAPRTSLPSLCHTLIDETPSTTGSVETGRMRVAAEVVAYVERAFAHVIARGGEGVTGSMPDEGAADASAGFAPGALRLWVHLNKARVCVLRGDGDGAERELEAAETPGVAAGTGVGGSIAREAERRYLKAHVQLLQNNHGEAMRLLVGEATRSCTNGGAGEGNGGETGETGGGEGNGGARGGGWVEGDELTGLPLGAPPCPQPLPASALSNAACVHSSAGKHAAAALLLHCALTPPPPRLPMTTTTDAAAAAAKGSTTSETAAATAAGGRTAGIAGMEEANAGTAAASSVAAATSYHVTSPSPTALYNLGLQRLMLGHHGSAARYFREASRWCSERPALWLRLAECATGHAHGITHPASRLSSRMVRIHNASEHGHSHGEDGDDDGDGSSALTSEYALMCLDNASILLERDEDMEASTSASAWGPGNGEGGWSGVGGDAGRAASSTATATATTAAAAAVRAGVYTHRAYVHLALGHPRAALKDAERLLRRLGGGSSDDVSAYARSPSSSSLSPSAAAEYALLGRCYAAEALCLLGRGEEAGAHLAACVAECEERRRRLQDAVAAATEAAEGGEEASGLLVRDEKEGAENHPLSCSGIGAATGRRDVGWDTATASDAAAPSRRHTSSTHRIGSAHERECDGDAAVLVHLAGRCAARGDLHAAEAHATRAWELVPTAPEPALLLAYLRLAAGDGAGARGVLRGRRLLAAPGQHQQHQQHQQHPGAAPAASPGRRGGGGVGEMGGLT